MSQNFNYKLGRSMSSTSRATLTGSSASVKVNVHPAMERSNTETGRGNFNKTTASSSAASDIDSKVKRAVGRMSENIHITANEPSLALFCLQEHIRKEIPCMIQQRNEFRTQHRHLQGTLYDCDYSIAAVKSIDNSGETFESIQNHLRNLLFLKQQLRYNENRRRQ